MLRIIGQRTHFRFSFFSITFASINSLDPTIDTTTTTNLAEENKQTLFDHQTEHLLTGFIGAPSGQWNTCAKSSEFDNVPITRNLPGEWTAVFSLFLVASGLIEPHHTCAKLRKNNCFPLAFKPGRVSSASPFVRNHLSYAWKSKKDRIVHETVQYVLTGLLLNLFRSIDR